MRGCKNSKVLGCTLLVSPSGVRANLAQESCVLARSGEARGVSETGTVGSRYCVFIVVILGLWMNVGGGWECIVTVTP